MRTPPTISQFRHFAKYHNFAKRRNSSVGTISQFLHLSLPPFPVGEGGEKWRNSHTTLTRTSQREPRNSQSVTTPPPPERPTSPCNHGKGKRRPERAERVQANVDGMAAIVDGAGVIPPNMGVGTPEGVRPVSRPSAEVRRFFRVTLFRPPRPIPNGTATGRPLADFPGQIDRARVIDLAARIRTDRPTLSGWTLRPGLAAPWEGKAQARAERLRRERGEATERRADGNARHESGREDRNADCHAADKRNRHALCADGRRLDNLSGHFDRVQQEMKTT